MARVRAISFDFGETLATIDHALFSEKLARRGVHVGPDALRRAAPDAWAVYEERSAGSADDGEGHHPWKRLMRRIIELAGASSPERHVDVIAELFEDQRVKNLWREPIPGMVELAMELRARGVKTAILSNSEGRMAELAGELGWADQFDALVDSGRLGVAKPERAIFEHTARALGVDVTELAHLGDSLRADVEGALGAGARAIWFAGPTSHVARPAPPSPDVGVATNAEEARALLLGLLDG